MKTFATTVVTLVLCQAVFAQSASSPSTTYSSPNQPLPTMAVPPGFGARLGPDYRHASTALEGALRGVADIMNASANQALGFSAAQINFEAARRVQMANNVAEVEAFWARRNAWQVSRAQELAARRAKLLETRQSAQKAPRAAAPAILRSTAGQIAWPTWLQGEEHTSYRKLVETVAYQRLLDGRVNTDDSARLIEATQQLLVELKGEVRQMRCDDYSAARRFLEQVAQEARDGQA